MGLHLDFSDHNSSLADLLDSNEALSLYIIVKKLISKGVISVCDISYQIHRDIYANRVVSTYGLNLENL